MRRLHFVARAAPFFCAAFLTVLPLVPLRAADETETDPWEDALNLDYNTASRKLARLYATNPSDARVATAHAAALLVRDPVTVGNITTARGILEKTLAALPLGETEHRPLALYLLGRIDHDHVEPARLDTAQATYEQLRREYPQHPLADQAAVHLALMLSMQVPEANPAESVGLVESLILTVSSEAALRELHFIAGHLHWRFREDAEAALPHYIAGRELGFEAAYRDSEVDLTIAGLARELGWAELAAKHYRSFAADNPRDTRSHTALRLAREMLGEAEPLNAAPHSGSE